MAGGGGGGIMADYGHTFNYMTLSIKEHVAIQRRALLTGCGAVRCGTVRDQE